MARYKLSPVDDKIVEQVLSAMEKAGYTDKRRNTSKCTLRGVLRRGYDLLRTPEGRSALMQEKTSYAAQKSVKNLMELIATVYGLEVGITLSRNGVVSVHRLLSSNSLWPSADYLVASFDLDSAAAKLTERRNKTNSGSGRPCRKDAALVHIRKRRKQAADIVEIKTETVKTISANIQKGVADCDPESLARMADFVTQQFRKLTRIAIERDAYQLQVKLCDQQIALLTQNKRDTKEDT